MTDTGFYHLTRTDVERALPRLLARSLQFGARALVLCGEPDRLLGLSAALWNAEGAWLPHNDAPDEDPDLQPIWLASADGPAPNGARFLFLVAGAEGGRTAEFERVFDLFDGGDEAAVAAARRRWAAAKAAGHALTYWRQNQRGGWEKGKG